MARLKTLRSASALNLSLALSFALAPAAFAASPGPDAATLVKLAKGFDQSSLKLEAALKSLGTEGLECSATYPALIRVSPNISANLAEKKPSTDGQRRDEHQTARFQKDQVFDAMDALLKRFRSEVAKASESGDGSGVSASLKEIMARTRELIEKEYAFKARGVAIGRDKRAGFAAQGALNSIREEKGDAHCVATAKAIDDADRINDELLRQMSGLLKEISALEKKTAAWAASVKPAPAPAPAVAAAPAAPKAEDCVNTPPANTLPIAGIAAILEKLPKQEPVKAPDAPPAAPKGAPVLAQAAPEEKSAPTAPAAKVAPTAPAFEATVRVTAVPATNDMSALLSPGRISAYVPAPFRAPNAAPATVAVAKAEAPAAAPTPEPAKVVARVETKVEAYDPSRDLWWDGKKRINWARLDRNKATLGLMIPEKATAAQLKPLAKKLAGRLDSLEGRVRLQKAINATAAKIDDGENGESPSVFQDGTLGSRTKNAAYYYFAKHRELFLTSLRTQGLIQ